MCSAPNVYMFVYILIGTHMVPLSSTCLAHACHGSNSTQDTCTENIILYKLTN